MTDIGDSVLNVHCLVDDVAAIAGRAHQLSSSAHA